MNDKKSARNGKATNPVRPDENVSKPVNLVRLDENVSKPLSQHLSSSIDDELEILCAKKDEELLQKSLEHSAQSARIRDKNEDLEFEFEKQMEELMLEKDKENLSQQVAEERQRVVHTEQLDGEHTDDLRLLENQENQPREKVKPSGFEFTPGTMEGGLHWPVLGQK